VARAWLPVFLCLLAGVAVAEADRPPRLIALAPNLAELVYIAGAGEQLVGAVEYSDYPAAALSVPRIGDAFRLDFEAMRRLQPDIVLAWGSGTPRPTISRLQDLGYNVVEFELAELADIATEIERIGALAGTKSAADQAAAQVRSDLSALRLSHTGRRPLTVFYQISASPWFTVSGEHVISEVIGLCGGVNVFADVPGLAPAVSLEAIVRANPQVVIAGTKENDWRADWQPWLSISAVSNGALYAVDPDLVNRATPRLLEGAKQICLALDTARAILP